MSIEDELGLVPPEIPAPEPVEEAKPAAEPEPPAEPAETPAPEPQAEEATPAAPEPEPEPPAAQPEPPRQAAQYDPAAEEEARKRSAALAEWQREYQEVRELVEKGEYDIIDHGPKATKVLVRGLEMLNAQLGQVGQEVQAQRAKTQAEQFFETYGRENSISPSKARSAWDECLNAARQEYGDPSAAIGAATERWKHKMATIKGMATASAPPAPPVTTPSKAPRPPTPVTKGGARPAPTASGTRPPTRARTIEDRLAAGEYGDLRNLMD